MESADALDTRFRSSAMAWLDRMRGTKPVFTRQELAEFEFDGRRERLVGPMRGIWKPSELRAALTISTGFYPEGSRRPYEDDIGPDGFARYKWCGTDPSHADNRALREAMRRELPLIWLLGVGYVPGSKVQLFEPCYPVYLVAEELSAHQFVVAMEREQQIAQDWFSSSSSLEVRYREQLVRARLHQPLFRSQVLHAYDTRCAVCALPFRELLDAAHIREDARAGLPRVSNGLSLCKIHHGAFDANILGIDSDYRLHVSARVLATVDGPTLEHALKGVDGRRLARLPTTRSSLPDRDALAERFSRFVA